VLTPSELLAQSAERFGKSTALITATRTFSYLELDGLCDATAAWLLKRGIKPGQAISIYAQNCWEWIVAYHAALRIGAVANPINAMLTSEELSFILDDCGSVCIFSGTGNVERAEIAAAVLPEGPTVVAFGETVEGTTSFDELTGTDPRGSVVMTPDPDSPCTIGYTSGTTGHPNGAVQSHRAVATNIALTATMHGRAAGDVVVTALPAAHVYGNVAINSTFLTGGTVVLLERFDATLTLRTIAEHQATMFEGVPAMYAMMLADPSLDTTDLSSLQRCTVGGQTMPTPLLDQWEKASGATLIELWGMTELSGLGLTHTLHTPRVPGSAGISLPGVAVRIANLEDSTCDAPLGAPGELMVRGSIVMLGYHRNPRATKEAIEPDGWLHTGDIATIDPAGYVRIVDRRKDLIITGGYNVYPAEIERVLIDHAGVALVAVAPVPDPIKGELACAYVVRAPRSNVKSDELLAYASARLAAYKRPRLIRFVDSLPLTSSGKVMRRKLIDLEWCG
jgi:long-chain acyl-CoA synthetase